MRLLIIALLGLLLIVTNTKAVTIRDFETTQLPTIKTVSNDQITIKER